MKKITFLMILMMMTAVLNAGQIVPKILIDNQTNGKLNSYSSETDPAMGLGVEYLQNLNENINVGGGLEYQFDRKITKANGASVPGTANFNYMPIYVTGEYLISMNNENIKPFAKVNLGYANYNVSGNAWAAGTSSSGDLYWAIGGGVTVQKNIKIELMYSALKGDRSVSSHSYNDEYSKISLGIGYVFDLKK
jgi:hypothetical protein